MNATITSPQLIDIELIHENTGQIDGLNSNPRELSLDNFDKLKESIQKYPEMLEYRSLLVYQYKDDYFIAIGGNMRLKAMQELNIEQAPCYIIPKDTDVDTLNAYTILDNTPFGKWDISKLRENFDLSQLSEFAINLPVFQDNLNLGDFFEDGDDETKTKIIITLPKELTDEKDDIKNLIKNELNKSFNGCKVK
jgi:hypothetical protein